MNDHVNSVDNSESLAEQVHEAFYKGTPLRISGGDTKLLQARPIDGKLLSVIKHQGIVEYAPTELVITVRSGTCLTDIEKRLAESGQKLAFEPPHLDSEVNGNATIGGVVSCGLSGPCRPYTGAVRDAVLGVRMINGRGEILNFGGQVMKNVAGYDVSRLMAGAQGTLGVLLDISLKVIPVPECEQTVCLEMKVNDAIQMMNQLAGKPVPLTAACYLPYEDGGQLENTRSGQLWLRLSGVESAIRSAAKAIGGEAVKSGQQFWFYLRERKLKFFHQQSSIWRVSVPPATPALPVSGSCLIDWGGAQRWVKTNTSEEKLLSVISGYGGHATLYHSQGGILPPLSPGLKLLSQRVKKSFDPKNILNPGRLYEWL